MQHVELEERLTNLQEQYPNANVRRVYHSAVGFYKTVQARWPSRQFARVLNGEGGRLGLIHNYTLYGLAYAPNELDGFAEYNNFVRRQYSLGEKYKWGHMSSLDDVLFEGENDSLYDRLAIWDKDIPDYGDDPLVVEGDRPSLGSLQALLPPLSLRSGRSRKGKMNPLSDDELDFLDTLAHVGTPTEAAILVGRTPKWGYGVLRKIRRLVDTTRVGVPST